MGPIDFAAGETKMFTVEWDWAKPEVSPDWSLVARGEFGAVTVTHTDNLTSHQLPYIPKGGSSDTTDPLDPTDIDDTTIVVPTDPMQESLNDWVLNFPIDSSDGFCGFILREFWDAEF